MLERIARACEVGLYRTTWLEAWKMGCQVGSRSARSWFVAIGVRARRADWEGDEGVDMLFQVGGCKVEDGIDEKGARDVYGYGMGWGCCHVGELKKISEGQSEVNSKTRGMI